MMSSKSYSVIVMGEQLEKYRTRRPLARHARGIAKDALQIVDYIESGRKAYAVKNCKTLVKRTEKLLAEVKKSL